MNYFKHSCVPSTLTCSDEGSIIVEAFRSNRATNVVLPQPVAPATKHVNGSFQRGSIWVNDWSTGRRVLSHFQRRRAKSVCKYFALPVEVGYRGSLLNARHHGRIAHAKAPIEPTTAPSVCQYARAVDKHKHSS